MPSSTQISYAGIIFHADSEFKVRFTMLWLFTFSRNKVWNQPMQHGERIFRNSTISDFSGIKCEINPSNTYKPTGTRIKIFGMIFLCNDAFDSYSRCKVIFNMHLNIYAHATQITLFYEIFRYTLAIYPDQGWL